MDKVAVIIPTLNGGFRFIQLLESLELQTIKPAKILVIDSESVDQTVPNAETFGCEIVLIRQVQFDHGGTRQMGVDRLSGAEIIIFLTQDAVLADDNALQQIVSSFSDLKVGAAYGRQIPDNQAGLIGAHARLLNYPENSMTKTMNDVSKLRLKTCFMSNSFAAYRKTALKTIGGFPENMILGEDMVTAAKMLLAGWHIAYCAEAQVFHYHNYKFLMEFKRYFDIGVMHSRTHWIIEKFGKPEGEGLRFVLSELRFLALKNFFLLPSALIRTVLKFAGYQLGIRERKIPQWLKRYLSMNKEFWRVQRYEYLRPISENTPNERINVK